MQCVHYSPAQHTVRKVSAEKRPKVSMSCLFYQQLFHKHSVLYILEECSLRVYRPEESAANNGKVGQLLRKIYKPKKGKTVRESD